MVGSVVSSLVRSPSRRRWLLAGATLFTLTVLLPHPAEARFGLRGGPLGVARFAVGHIIGLSRLRHARMAVRSGRTRTAALRPNDPRGAARGKPANPYVLRAALTAQAALAGWHGGRRAQGWWRHPDGSYGWAGPVFWPFAHDDLTNAIVLGDATALSLYGYGDIYAALFAPYAPAELAAYVATKPSARTPSAASICEASDGGGLPVERIAAAVQPNEAQRTALDELAAAFASARDTIREACPTKAPANAAERVSLMKARLAAMIKALDALAAPLSKFEDLLDDGQKAKFEALAKERHAALAAVQRKDATAAAACAPDYDPRYDVQAQRDYQQLVQQQWPAETIATTLRLDDIGRARFEVLQDTTLRALETLNPCPTRPGATAQARLQAVKARLQTMQQAVNEVADALDDFQADLSDEQKARFEAIGPKRGA